MEETKRDLACRITAAFCEGAFDLASRRGAPRPGWDGMPEVAVAKRLRADGASDVDVRLFATFTAAMDRARDADRLWHAAGKMFLEHRWTYQPEEICNRPLLDLANTLRAYGVSQRHSLDTAAWRTIARTLFTSTRTSPVDRAIFDGEGDAQELLRYLWEIRADDGRSAFPFLRGPKVGPMWVRMLAYPGGAAITSLDALPVAVDVQVRKVTEYLGVTDTHDQDLERVRRLIQNAWAVDVRRHGAVGPGSLADTPAALDPALWFFGKWGCTYCERFKRKVPISNICQECRFDVLYHPRSARRSVALTRFTPVPGTLRAEITGVLFFGAGGGESRCGMLATQFGAPTGQIGWRRS